MAEKCAENHGNFNRALKRTGEADIAVEGAIEIGKGLKLKETLWPDSPSPLLKKKMTGNMFASQRLLADYDELRKDAPEGISGCPSEDNLNVWDVTVPSPSGKPLHATLYFNDYPFRPPEIYFTAKLFHPNINSNGRVCIEGIDWTPAHTIRSLLASVQCLLVEPNPHNPINFTAAKMFIDDQPKYQQLAIQSFEKAENCQQSQKNQKLGSQVSTIGTVKMENEDDVTEIDKNLLPKSQLKQSKETFGPNYPPVTEIKANANGNLCVSKRLRVDYEKLFKDAPEGISGFPFQDNMNIWYVTIPSPNGKPLKASLYFSDNFPFQPPEIYFAAQLFHPNIDRSGKVCIIDTDWTSNQTIWSLLASVQCLLAEPNTHDPINEPAAKLFLHNQRMYQYLASYFFKTAENYQLNQQNQKMDAQDSKIAILNGNEHNLAEVEEALLLQSHLEEIYCSKRS